MATKTLLCNVLPGRPSATVLDTPVFLGGWKGRVTDVRVRTAGTGSFVLVMGLLSQRITLSVAEKGETVLHLTEDDWAPLTSVNGFVYRAEHSIENNNAEVLSLECVVVLTEDAVSPVDLSRLL